MNDYIDAHNHILDVLPIKSIYNTYQVSDINNLSKVNNKYINVGIHPLYTSEFYNYINLITFLNNPYINIGEIGLDRRNKKLNEQIIVFKKFLDLGIKYKKSISIHCVNYWGLVLDILNELNIEYVKILFHGFSGSIETYEILKKYNSYFSFSLNMLNREKIIHLIKSIPIEKILIESDMTNIKYIELGLNGYLDQIHKTYNRISEIKELPLEDVICKINENFKIFIKEE